MKSPRIKHIKGSLFWVESNSEPGKFYEVDMNLRRCQCKAYEYGKPCRHVAKLFNSELNVEPTFNPESFRAPEDSNDRLKRLTKKHRIDEEISQL